LNYQGSEGSDDRNEVPTLADREPQVGPMTSGASVVDIQRAYGYRKTSSAADERESGRNAFAIAERIRQDLRQQSTFQPASTSGGSSDPRVVNQAIWDRQVPECLQGEHKENQGPLRIPKVSSLRLVRLGFISLTSECLTLWTITPASSLIF
jgi:hypothetical protein